LRAEGVSCILAVVREAKMEILGYKHLAREGKKTTGIEQKETGHDDEKHRTG
jgi:hypothetical protein